MPSNTAKGDVVGNQRTRGQAKEPEADGNFEKESNIGMSYKLICIFPTHRFMRRVTPTLLPEPKTSSGGGISAWHPGRRGIRSVQSKTTGQGRGGAGYRSIDGSLLSSLIHLEPADGGVMSVKGFGGRDSSEEKMGKASNGVVR